jgi:hypothetical protein
MWPFFENVKNHRTLVSRWVQLKNQQFSLKKCLAQTLIIMLDSYRKGTQCKTGSCPATIHPFHFPISAFFKIQFGRFHPSFLKLLERNRPGGIKGAQRVLDSSRLIFLLHWANEWSVAASGTLIKRWCVHCHMIQTRGVSDCGLAIYIKRYLKAKEELWKLKYFPTQKYNLQNIL